MLPCCRWRTTSPAPTVTTSSHRCGSRMASSADGDFAAATAALPTLITHARWSLAESTEDQRRSAWAPLAQAYLLAAALLTQLRKDDLAYHTLGLAPEAGASAQDNGLVGSAVGGETWLLIRQGGLDDATRVALAAAERLEPSFGHADRRHLSSWGWLNLGVAAAAARNSQRDVMTDAMRRAWAAAVRIEGDGPGSRDWSSFGPTVVTLRDTEMAVVTGSPDKALRIAARVPAPLRPTNTSPPVPARCRVGAAGPAQPTGSDSGVAGTARRRAELAAAPAVRQVDHRQSAAGHSPRRSARAARPRRVPPDQLLNYPTAWQFRSGRHTNCHCLSLGSALSCFYRGAHARTPAELRPSTQVRCRLP